MKKKIVVCLLSLCLATSMVACGGSDKESDTKTEANGEEKSDAEDGADETTGDYKVTKDTRIVTVSAKDMDKYVKLGDYKGLEATKEVIEVTDSDVDSQIQTELAANLTEVTDENAEAKEGDTVNIDYEGKVDGVAFDGGTDTGYDLELGSGSFIPGFEDGLIGAKKGETRDVNVTFPDEYTEELAGKDAVFTVTVNAIKQSAELTEDWVKENTEYDSIDAYKESVRESLQAQNATTAEQSVQSDVWNQVLESSEILEYPQEDMDAALQEQQDMLQSYADQSGVSTDEFLTSQNMTAEQFEEQSQQYAQQKIQQDLVVQAIMDAEGLDLTNDMFRSVEEELLTTYGAEDVAALADQYGEKSVNEIIAVTGVVEYVTNNAKVTEKTADGEDIVNEDAATEEEAE